MPAPTHRGKLGTQRLSHYFDCGATAGISNADQYDILIRVITQIIPAEAGLSALRTQVEATGACERDVGTGGAMRDHGCARGAHRAHGVRAGGARGTDSAVRVGQSARKRSSISPI